MSVRNNSDKYLDAAFSSPNPTESKQGKRSSSGNSVRKSLSAFKNTDNKVEDFRLEKGVMSFGEINDF